MERYPYGPPIAVSPLIRGARYAFLLAGIFYGVIKQNMYEQKEKLFQEEEAKKKKIRDKENAILRAKIAAEERETVKLLESGKLFDPPEETFIEEIIIEDHKKKPVICTDDE